MLATVTGLSARAVRCLIDTSGHDCLDVKTLLAQSRALLVGIGAVSDVIELVGGRLNAVIDCIEAGATVNEYWTEARALLKMQRYAVSISGFVAQRSLLGTEQMSVLDPYHSSQLCGSDDSQILSDANLEAVQLESLWIMTLQGLHDFFTEHVEQ